MSGDESAAFFRERKACVAGEKLARRFGWNIGDTITLRGTIFPGNWDFVLRGIYQGKDKTIDENQFFFHWDYLNETMKKNLPRRADQVGFYMIGLKQPDQAAATSESVDGLFKNSYAETLTETEKAFQMSFVSMSEAIITVIQLVSYVIIVIIMAVVANTMAMSVRERMDEYAVFKTLGFGRGFLAGLILGESLTLTAIGGLLGIGITFPAARAFAQAVGQFFPIFHVSTETILMDMAAAATVGSCGRCHPDLAGGAGSHRRWPGKDRVNEPALFLQPEKSSHPKADHSTHCAWHGSCGVCVCGHHHAGRRTSENPGRYRLFQQRRGRSKILGIRSPERH